MSGDAVKRLQAIKEFTELGSGFKIALRDLEIRERQYPGSRTARFYDGGGAKLYCRLLQQAIETMKGKKIDGQHKPNPGSI